MQAYKDKIGCDITPEIIDLNCPHLNHYYTKAKNNFSYRDRFQFRHRSKNYQCIHTDNFYLEDVEKAVDFLKSDLLKLVGKAPVIVDYFDLLLESNCLRRGVIQNDIISKRFCVGSIETERIEEVLSKDLGIKFVKLAEKTFNEEDRKVYTLIVKIKSLDKEEIIQSILCKIDGMNHFQFIHPNIILLPINLYNAVYDEELKPNIITKTDKRIEDIDVWINPHVKDVVLYYNPYYKKDFNSNFCLETSVMFVYQMLFGIKSLTNEIYKMKDTKLYNFKYAICEISDVYKNFCLIPVEL